MKWYFPSWNGDIRIEADKDPHKTILTAIKPTLDEQRVLKSLAKIFYERGWIKRKTLYYPSGKKKEKDITIVSASMLEIGTLLISHLKPGLATLTAVKMKDGSIEAMSNSDKGVLKWLEQLFGADKKAPIGMTKDLADALEAASKDDTYRHTEPVEKEPLAATTVKRPTPSCPQCYVDAIAPSTEVLLSFLDEKQHEQWMRTRSIFEYGGLSGHRYLLTHRHSKLAAKLGKICYDCDDQAVLHFHDNSVPPEEEILAAMLCLKFREPWLRNEATCLSPGGDCNNNHFDFVFKNPFGDQYDGTEDSIFVGQIGSFLRGFLINYNNGQYALRKIKTI